MISEVLGDRNALSAEDLEKLDYTEQILLEALRMYPLLVGTFKTSNTDIFLGEYRIPAGNIILLPNEVMCHMPEYYDELDVFNPSRFDPQSKRPNPCVYFPFGLGHRSCIGKNFAIIEAKIILARLVHNFKITLPPEYEIIICQRTVNKLKDLPCTLEPRRK